MKQNYEYIKEFYDFIEPMRDLDAWKKNDSGEWELADPIWVQEKYSSKEEFGKRAIIFSDEYKEMYYNPNNEPEASGEDELDFKSSTFKWL